MAYEALFLERADLAKYQMYVALDRLSAQDISITDLAKHLALKYQAAYAVFQDILNDLEDLADQPRRVVRDALLEPGPVPVAMDRYRAYLMQNGQVFQLFDYLLRASRPALDDFLEEHFVSRSTILRKLRPVNAYLKRLGFQFKLTKMMFTGSEMGVRYFLFTMYWWGFRGSGWPFAPIIEKEMEAEVQQVSILGGAVIQARQDAYFMAVSHLRLGKHRLIGAHKFLRALDERIASAGLRAGTLPPPVTHDAIAFFNFFELSMPRFDAASRRPEDLACELGLLTNEHTQRTVDTLAKAADSLRAPTPDPDLRLNLFRLTYGYLLLEAPFPQTEDYLQDGDTPVGSAKLQALLKQYLEPVLADSPYAGHLGQLPGYVRQASALIYPYVDAVLRPAQVQVNLDVSPVRPGVKSAREFIDSVPWVAQCTDAPGDVAVVDDAKDGVHLPPERVVQWSEGAMGLDVFRHQLVDTIMAARHQLLAAAN